MMRIGCAGSIAVFTETESRVDGASRAQSQAIVHRRNRFQGDVRDHILHSGSILDVSERFIAANAGSILALHRHDAILHVQGKVIDVMS